MIYVVGLFGAFYVGLFLGCLLSSRRIREAEEQKRFAVLRYEKIVETVSARTDQVAMTKGTRA